MKYYVLEPEVAGGFGPKSILDPTVHPPRVSRFNYQFDGWLGDSLIETFGCFIVTYVLRQKIERANASGVAFGSVEISKSREFEELFPDQELPDFVWLQACGKAGVDDFGLSADNRLVASERMLALCREEGISHCVIVEFK